MNKHRLHHHAGRLLAALVGFALAAVQPARAADALRIGFSMSLSGGYLGNAGLGSIPKSGGPNE